jgi:hypothetical protein
MVHMAIGWFAREEKLHLDQEKRTIKLWLKGVPPSLGFSPL